MFVKGSECSIVIKTEHREMDVPYSDETIREAVSLLEENACIEGDGVKRGLRKISGITGCVVTPLTIGTAPLLLCLAMGAAGKPVFVSETRNLYRVGLELLPLEDSDCFDLIQDRGSERKLFEHCKVKGFELRIMRDEAVKLKLDISGGSPSRIYPAMCQAPKAPGTERFSGDFVSYQINGKEYRNIYGLTLVSKKQGGTKTELWIKRALQSGDDIQSVIEEITITARLWRDCYEYRQFGTFRITLKRLVMISDETEINAADTVIGPLRYYVSGTVSTEVFTSNDEALS